MEPKALPEVSSFLTQFGIALVYEVGLPGMKLDGTIFRIRSGQVVIGMTLRYARLDNYWFTLLHELAHAALHSEHLDVPIVDDLDVGSDELVELQVDDLDVGSDELVELQADRLAGDSLIPKNEWRSCPARYTLAEADVLAFASRMRISPQSVAGRIRRDTGRFELFSQIVNQHNTRELLGVEEI